jgi:serine/threonine protein kinase
MPVDSLRQTMQTIGEYDLLEKIAEGGMGTVYKGRHRDGGSVVAVKVVPAHMVANPIFMKRFEQEYVAAKALDHPNIVRAIDFGKENGTPFLVMEYVEGESLGQRLERETHLSEAEAIRITTEVAEGLHKAHKMGMIHRDVKPDNVLLTADGQVKLTDLGLVKELETDLNLTRTGRGLGTPHFMAPEQFRNAKNADVKCDIYSLAASLYMMVTGELPFKSNGPLDAWMKKVNNEIPAPRSLNPELSERIDWAIRRGMSPDPVQRPETCREFIEDLTGHSTRKLVATEPDQAMVADLWFLVYKDDDGVTHTVKGTTSAIRRSLKEGLLGNGDNIRIARCKTGPFEPVRSYPEFRDLLIQPSTVARAVKPTPDAKVTQPIDSRTMRTAQGPSKVVKRQIPGPSTEPAPVPALSTGQTPAPATTTSTKVQLAMGMPKGPQIHLTPPREEATDWWKVLGVLIVTVALGAAGYLLLPYLSRFRMPF